MSSTIDRSKSRDNLFQSLLVTDSPDDVDLDLYDATHLDLLNKRAPEREEVVSDLTNSAWMDEAVIWAKRARRRAKRKKRRTGLVVHIEL